MWNSESCKSKYTLVALSYHLSQKCFMGRVKLSVDTRHREVRQSHKKYTARSRSNLQGRNRFPKFHRKAKNEDYGDDFGGPEKEAD